MVTIKAVHLYTAGYEYVPASTCNAQWPCLLLLQCEHSVLLYCNGHGLHALLKPVAHIQNLTHCLLQLHCTVCVTFSLVHTRMSEILRSSTSAHSTGHSNTVIIFF